MPCEHKFLKSVNCLVSCMDCGKTFTAVELQNLNKPKETNEESEKAQETEKPNRRKAKKEDKQA